MRTFAAATITALALARQAAVAQPPFPPGGRRAPRPDNAPSTLQRRVPADAGSRDAPILLCIGLHIEPLGAAPSALVSGATDTAPDPPRPPRAGKRPGGRAPGGPSYEFEGLFQRHVADLKTLAQIVERHRGKLSIQAQTPFTRKLVEAGDTLLGDLERRGHEIALHFHEDAHLGRNCGALPPGTWTAVMREEIDWIHKAGARRIRYWSGGNLYPHLLLAASGAGLQVMSDFKNPRTQRDDERLLAVHPWRPAAGPSETDLSGFASHDPAGPIVYLPNGIFERADHSQMRRSPEMGGDYPYFDSLTRGLELSLRAARANRPAAPPADATPAAAPGAGRVPPRAHITFVVNTHDWGRVEKSAGTILRLVDLFARYRVRGDFYLTAPIAEAYARSRPDVIARLRECAMTMKYHESGTAPEEPFAWRQGLLIRPSDFSVTRWSAPGETRESFWWNRQDTPAPRARHRPHPRERFPARRGLRPGEG